MNSSNSPSPCNCFPKLTGVSCAFWTPGQWDTGLLKVQLYSDLTQVRAIFNLTAIYSDVTTYFVPGGMCRGHGCKGAYHLLPSSHAPISCISCFPFRREGRGAGLTKSFAE